MSDDMVTVDRGRCPACGCKTGNRFSDNRFLQGHQLNPYAAQIRVTTAHFSDGEAAYHIEWECGRCGAKWTHKPETGDEQKGSDA